MLIKFVSVSMFSLILSSLGFAQDAEQPQPTQGFMPLGLCKGVETSYKPVSYIGFGYTTLESCTTWIGNLRVATVEDATLKNLTIPDRDISYLAEEIIPALNITLFSGDLWECVPATYITAGDELKLTCPEAEPNGTQSTTISIPQ